MSDERYIPFTDEVVVIHGTVTKDKLTKSYFRYDDESAVYEVGSSRLVCSVDRLRKRSMKTPEERAREVANCVLRTSLTERIAKAIREAVAEEREACRDAVLFSNNAARAIEMRGGLEPARREHVLRARPEAGTKQDEA